MKVTSQTDDNKKIYHVRLIGEIDADSVGHVIEELDIGSSKDYVDEIQLTLMSYGGDILLGMGLYDHIKSIGKPSTIIAEGVCMSVAVTILQAGTNRYSRPHTQFMVHPTLSSLEERSFPEFISIVEHYKKNHDLFVKLTIERSGMPKEEFEHIYTPRKYLTPEEALHFGNRGLIDKII